MAITTTVHFTSNTGAAVNTAVNAYSCTTLVAVAVGRVARRAVARRGNEGQRVMQRVRGVNIHNTALTYFPLPAHATGTCCV